MSGRAPEGALDHRFEAMIFDWDAMVVPAAQAEMSRLRALIEELCSVGLSIGLVSGGAPDGLDSRLHARPSGADPGCLLLASNRDAEVFMVGSDGPRLVDQAESGLRDTEDAVRLLLGLFARRGVGSGLVAIVGDESASLAAGTTPAGNGSGGMLALLDDQLARRRAGDVPAIDEDPAWTVVVEGFDREHERVNEALLTLADGRLGTSGSPLTGDGATTPWVFATGLYDGDGPETALLACPVWHRLPGELGRTSGLRRVLDLRTGVLREECSTASGLRRSLRFSSLTRPACVVLRAECDTEALSAPPLQEPVDGPPTDAGADPSGRFWMRVAASAGGVVAAASQHARPRSAGGFTLERLGAYSADATQLPAPLAALEQVEGLERVGFEALLAEHRTAWVSRWDAADVTISGDDDLQHAVRVALFHLMASVPDTGEAAVGARGLTGPAYRGHVFWDADVFVLPFLAATHPLAARAMLEYRVRRLPQARAAAAVDNRRGARFPWESARDGRDVTPTHAYDHTGRVMPIRTGALEEHVVACVAWAAAHYLDWTGDEEFAAGAGRELLIETARYWASRVRLDAAGQAHIYGVIGPDEYHEPVDDNAFTNVMARWNLRRAAMDEAVDDDERARWLELAAAIVDGYDPETGRYEQFAGFSDLELLVIADIAPRRPVAADLLLGAERVGAAQILKQADVLMLHHLVPDDVALGSLIPNLDYYEPRTAHGSSLSPGIHAALFARAGRPDEALAPLRIASRIDLDDLTRSTGGGLHLATYGSTWQALVYGFLGVRPLRDTLAIDPHLPAAWTALEATVNFRGCRVNVRAAGERVEVTAEREIAVHVFGERRVVGPGGAVLTRLRSDPDPTRHGKDTR